MNYHLRLFLQSIFGRTSENYGHNQILREYTGYPRFLPLNAQIQHGWYGTEIPDFKKIHKIPFMLAWSVRIAELWRDGTTKPVFVLGAPFVLYREMHGIKQKEDASGTVVFPDHSTPSTTVDFDVQSYCDELKKLPSKMQPVTACLHFRDVDRYGSVFEKNGFTVVTAGDSRQGGAGFVSRFYNILSSHRYSCSNNIGSYTFYSVEIGIPFFIYGSVPKCIVNIDQKIVKEDIYRKKLVEKFIDIHDEPTAEQMELVLLETGVNDRVSPEFLRLFFLKRFFFYEIPRYPFRFILAVIRTAAKVPGKIAGTR